MQVSSTVEEFEDSLRQYKARKLISMAEYRRLKASLGRARSQELLVNLKAELLSCFEESYHFYGDQLTKSVGEDCRRFRVPNRRSVLWMARWVASNPRFRRLSCKVRKYYNGFREVPVSDVCGHSRKGRPVRQHYRLRGHGHLLELRFEGCHPAVEEVLHLIARGDHRVSRRR